MRHDIIGNGAASHPMLSRWYVTKKLPSQGRKLLYPRWTFKHLKPVLVVHHTLSTGQSQELVRKWDRIQLSVFRTQPSNRMRYLFFNTCSASGKANFYSTILYINYHVCDIIQKIARTNALTNMQYRACWQSISLDKQHRTWGGSALCFPVPMFQVPMFPNLCSPIGPTYVPRFLCSPVPMFPGFWTVNSL